MAFKILSEEMLDLLTDNQKIQYERELDIYNKRVAFVAQLEKYENVVFEPYKPKLKPVAVINQTEFKAYQKREYKAQLQDPIKKPELQVISVEIMKPTNIDLPKVSVPAVETKPIIIENNQPILPTVTKPVATILNFTITEAEQLDLPVFAKPGVAVVVFKQPKKSLIELPLVEKPIFESSLSTDGLKIETIKSPSNIPSIILPNISVPAFATPIKEIPSLPFVAVAGPAVKSFSKPEQKAVELPTVSEAAILLKPIKIEKTSAPQLPKKQSVFKPVTTYTKPEIPMSGLPNVAKPNIAIAFFQPPEIDGLHLPSTVVKPPNIAIAFFQPLEIDGLHLPSTVVKPPIPKKISPIKTGKVDITAPRIQVISVNSFTKLDYKFAEVPKQSKTKIPDARVTLEKFFPVSNEEANIPAGQVV